MAHRIDKSAYDKERLSNPTALARHRRLGRLNYLANREARCAYTKAWNKAHPGHTAAYLRARRKNDVCFKLGELLRGKINKSLRRGDKTGHMMDLLGCSLESFKCHIEAQFTTGMTWLNHGFGEGKWHIDHMRPICSFDLSDPTQQARCFHYTNLQPLWQLDNMRKSGQVTPAIPVREPVLEIDESIRAPTY